MCGITVYLIHSENEKTHDYKTEILNQNTKKL